MTLTSMPTRELRLVKQTPSQTIGICSCCSKQFKSYLPRLDQARWEISTRFSEHKCKPLTMPQPFSRTATPRKRGNPNWGKPPQDVPPIATEFELYVRRLGLRKKTYATSARLRAWCEDNKYKFYIPEWLLVQWGMVVDGNAVELSSPNSPRNKWG